MRAVNLIPGQERSSRAIGSAGAGAIVYVLLGGLAVMVALVGLWTSSSRQISDRSATLDQVDVQARVAEASAAKAAPYADFASLAHERVATIRSLSGSRFGWAHGLRELSRVLPADVWLSSLTGTSGANGSTTSPSSSPAAGAAAAPTFELVGCAGSQAKVARLMARVRAVDGVRSVDLKASEKPDGGGDADCPANSTHNPTFTLSIDFAAPGSPKAQVDAAGQIVTGAAAAPGAPATPGAAAAPTATPAPAAPAPAAGATSSPSPSTATASAR